MLEKLIISHRNILIDQSSFNYSFIVSSNIYKVLIISLTVSVIYWPLECTAKEFINHILIIVQLSSTGQQHTANHMPVTSKKPRKFNLFKSTHWIFSLEPTLNQPCNGISQCKIYCFYWLICCFACRVCQGLEWITNHIRRRWWLALILPNSLGYF